MGKEISRDEVQWCSLMGLEIAHECVKCMAVGIRETRVLHGINDVCEFPPLCEIHALEAYPEECVDLILEGPKES
jgi:hypothetical protein